MYFEAIYLYNWVWVHRLMPTLNFLKGKQLACATWFTLFYIIKANNILCTLCEFIPNLDPISYMMCKNLSFTPNYWWAIIYQTSQLLFNLFKFNISIWGSEQPLNAIESYAQILCIEGTKVSCSLILNLAYKCIIILIY